MFYIEALNLIDLCLEHGVLSETEGGIPVYRDRSETSPEGWYLESKPDLAQELMHDEDGIVALSLALQQKQVNVEGIYRPDLY